MRSFLPYLIYKLKRNKYEAFGYYQMSHVMRKPDFYLCENKSADQLCTNCTGDQRLCFCYSYSTIPPLPLPKISRLYLLRLYRPVCVRHGRNCGRLVFSPCGSYVKRCEPYTLKQNKEISRLYVIKCFHLKIN